MKNFVLGLTFVLAIPTAAFALPSPADVWNCLQESDPAMQSDGDGYAGTNPILCHLEHYNVTEIKNGLHVDAKFTCLTDSGKRKATVGQADCATNLPK